MVVCVGTFSLLGTVNMCSIAYELKIYLFVFNLDQFCDIFHIILKSLPGSVVFLFYLTEFRLKMIKLICLVFLLLNGLAGPGKLQAPFSCLPISPRLFWSLWRSRCPGELPPGTGECTYSEHGRVVERIFFQEYKKCTLGWASTWQIGTSCLRKRRRGECQAEGSVEGNHSYSGEFGGLFKTTREKRFLKKKYY